MQKHLKPLLALLLFIPGMAVAQLKLSPDSAVAMALRNNGTILAAQKQNEAAYKNIRTGLEVGKTNFNLLYGQINSYPKNDNNFTISQGLPFPITMSARKNWYKAQYGESGAEYKMACDQLALDIRNACIKMDYLTTVLHYYEEQAGLMEKLMLAAKARYESGATGILEWQLSQSRNSQNQIQLNQTRQELQNVERYLQAQLHTDSSLQIDLSSSAKRPLLFTPDLNAEVQGLEAKQERLASEIHLEKSSFWPELQFSYFNQSFIDGPTGSEPNAPLATSGNRFQGFGVGLSIPIFAGAQNARIQSVRLQSEASYYEVEQKRRDLKTEWQNALDNYLVASNNLEQFEKEILPLSNSIREQAKSAYEKGELSYTEYLIQLNEALAIQERHAELSYQREVNYHQILWLQGSIQ